MESHAQSNPGRQSRHPRQAKLHRHLPQIEKGFEAQDLHGAACRHSGTNLLAPEIFTLKSDLSKGALLSRARDLHTGSTNAVSGIRRCHSAECRLRVFKVRVGSVPSARVQTALLGCWMPWLLD